MNGVQPTHHACACVEVIPNAYPLLFPRHSTTPRHSPFSNLQRHPGEGPHRTLQVGRWGVVSDGNSRRSLRQPVACGQCIHREKMARGRDERLRGEGMGGGERTPPCPQTTVTNNRTPTQSVYICEFRCMSYECFSVSNYFIHRVTCFGNYWLPVSAFELDHSQSPENQAHVEVLSSQRQENVSD